MSGGSANPGAGRDQTERSRRKLLASYLFFLVIISELPFLSIHNLSGDTPCYNRGMDVIVCHISALHYWLSHIGSPRIDALQSALAPQLGIPLRESEIAAAVSILPKERQREKVHLLTKTHEAARHSHDIAVHTTSLELTPADFHLAAPGVFVCSPEFALIQSAQTLDEIEFLRIAFALCGTYRVGTNDAYPLTTPLKINQMLTRMTGLNGAKFARRLTPYILAGAASPRETQLVLHLCLPYRMGGYGIAYPQLNPRIDLPAHVQRLTGNSVLFPDLFWPDKNIAVEYDSDKWHTGSSRIANDARRRNIFVHLGITEICVTKREFNDLIAFDKTARILSRRLRHRVHPRSEEFDSRQMKLRKKLLAPLLPVQK